MKYFLAIALIATVASAGVLRPVPFKTTEIQEIIDAIQSPSTNPATAAALEQMLLDMLGLTPEPIVVGPAIIEQTPVGGPAIIEFPVVEPSPVVVAPGPVAETPASSAPLVQIILNINQASASPVEVIDNRPVDPVNVVDEAPAQIVDVMPIVTPELPIQIEDIMPIVTPELPIQIEDIMPIIVPDLPIQIEDIPVAVQPVDVVEVAPVAVEPVQIGTPVIPSPAVVLPEQLN